MRCTTYLASSLIQIRLIESDKDSTARCRKPHVRWYGRDIRRNPVISTRSLRHIVLVALNTNADNASMDKGKLQASWQNATDTSKVWAAAIATATNADNLAISVDSIPWLTLQVKGTLAGPTGGENLIKTTYIQRINTVAGVAPDPLAAESLCDATHIATRFLAPYQTDYLFYKLGSVDVSSQPQKCRGK